MAKGARRAATITEEHRHAARWYYLSFADDGGFLGGVIVGSCGFLTAIQRATELGINPGGEVMCTPIPRKDLCRVPPDLRNQLLPQDKVRNRLEGRGMGDESGAVTAYIPPEAGRLLSVPASLPAPQQPSAGVVVWRCRLWDPSRSVRRRDRFRLILQSSTGQGSRVLPLAFPQDETRWLPG